MIFNYASFFRTVRKVKKAPQTCFNLSPIRLSLTQHSVPSKSLIPLHAVSLTPCSLSPTPYSLSLTPYSSYVLPTTGTLYIISCFSLGFVDCDVTSDFDDSASFLASSSDLLVFPLQPQQQQQPLPEVESSDESLSTSQPSVTCAAASAANTSGLEEPDKAMETEDKLNTETLRFGKLYKKEAILY